MERKTYRKRNGAVNQLMYEHRFTIAPYSVALRGNPVCGGALLCCGHGRTRAMERLPRQRGRQTDKGGTRLQRVGLRRFSGDRFQGSGRQTERGTRDHEVAISIVTWRHRR